MTTQAFDFAHFQALFPALSTTTQPQAQAWWDAAQSYIVQPNSLMTDAALNLALNLMTAHLTQSAAIIAGGSGLVGPIASAGEGTVNVAVVPPPVPLAPAPPGHRPAGTTARATAPHHTWQMDAAEAVDLADGAGVS